MSEFLHRKPETDRPRMRDRGIYLLPNLFTTGALFAGFYAIVQATRHYNDPDMIAKVSRGLGEAMVGINVADIPVHHRLEDRGW
jgi:pyridoxal 5'-phosphate synthase pdxS subunit